MRTSRRLRRTVAGLALACAGALAVPAVATAAPTVPSVPESNPLLDAIALLEGTGSGDGTGSAEGTDPADPAGPTDTALDAARAVLGAAPTVDVAEPNGNPLALVDAANGLLQGFGLTPFFYPTAALNCSALPGVPFGVVPAVAGAAPGPYTPKVPGVGALPGVDTTIADPGETLYAFVPAPGGVVNDAANKTGMQVAWFNVNTLKGGFADMGGLADVISSEIIDGLPAPIQGPARDLVQRNLAAFPSAGVRLAPVATGSGTVLAAVFGQVTHDGKTCAFFPTVGLTQVP